VHHLDKRSTRGQETCDNRRYDDDDDDDDDTDIIIIIIIIIIIMWEPSYLSSITLGYGLDDWRFESLQGLGIYLYITTSRQALGPTQALIQGVPVALSLD
jgi:hypothetical protein